MMLTPHELVKIGAHHLVMHVMATSHSLYLDFDSVPGCRVDELNAVVRLLSNRREVLYIIVRCPHITPDYYSLDYGEESGSITGGN